MKLYKAKSLKSAERFVRNLRKKIHQREFLLEQFNRERKTLARLAAETPQFSNPIHVMEAKQLRDNILKYL